MQLAKRVVKHTVHKKTYFNEILDITNNFFFPSAFLYRGCTVTAVGKIRALNVISKIKLRAFHLFKIYTHAYTEVDLMLHTTIFIRQPLSN